MSVYCVNTIIESKSSARQASNSTLSRRALLSVPNCAIRRRRSLIRSRSLIVSSSGASATRDATSSPDITSSDVSSCDASSSVMPPVRIKRPFRVRFSASKLDASRRRYTVMTKPTAERFSGGAARYTSPMKSSTAL